MVDKMKKKREVKSMSQKIDKPLNNIFNSICEDYGLNKIDLMTYLFDYSKKYQIDEDFINKHLTQIKLVSVKLNIETIVINIEKNVHLNMKNHIASIKNEMEIKLTMEQYIRLLALWFFYKSGFNKELDEYLQFLHTKTLNPFLLKDELENIHFVNEETPPLFAKDRLYEKKSINGDSYSSIFNSLLSVKNEFELIAKKASEVDSYEEANLLSIKVTGALEKFVDLIPLMVDFDNTETFKPECLEIKSLYTAIKKQFIKYRIVV